MASKRGAPFEKVVAAVLKTMDPNASVTRGQWVQGPDGRRELDVLVKGTVDGQARCVLVECKDFDPKSTGPVGIAHVDALDSKRNDLAVDFAAICSNSGFTGGAVRKAARVGIGLIAIMKRGDKRIRFSVTEQIFTRRLTVEKLTITLHGPRSIDLAQVALSDVCFADAPIENWVLHRALQFIIANPIVNGSFDATHKLKSPLECRTPTGSVAVTQIDFRLQISGGWYAHTVTLDATAAVYDWLRHRVRVASGPGEFMIEGVDAYAGVLIATPPERVLAGFQDVRKGELDFRIVLVSGMVEPESVPPLDEHIEPEDLVLTISGLSADELTSVSPSSAAEEEEPSAGESQDSR